MFTGIITEMGTIVNVEDLGGGVRITVDAPESVLSLGPGDSIACNGACQTVVNKQGSQFSVEAVEETLKKTTLGSLTRGQRVNLELPLRLGDRLGGHMVQGHVDGVGHIARVNAIATSTLIDVELPPDLMGYVIPVGSIAIDGISLTVASVGRKSITVSIIPHTLEHTTLCDAKKGMAVNVECDLIGKYIQNLAARGKAVDRQGIITTERLSEWGYDLNP